MFTRTVTTRTNRRWATLAEAGEHVGLSQKTLRRQIAAGHITGYRIGRALRVDLNELDDLLRPIPTAGGAA